MSTDAIISIKAPCPTCRSDRNADVLFNFKDLWEDDDENVWCKTDHRILRCKGCDSVYFQKVTTFSEDLEYVRNAATGDFEGVIGEKFEYWPALSKREKPVWSFGPAFNDQNLSSLFDDIYVALDNDLHVLAAIGIRTVFDRASELLGVDPGLTFNKKLDKLVDEGKIGTEERTTLAILTDAGSAAAHRGWRPSPEDLDTMMSLVEQFLHKSFISGQAANSLRAAVPPRRRRS